MLPLFTICLEAGRTTRHWSISPRPPLPASCTSDQHTHIHNSKAQNAGLASSKRHVASGHARNKASDNGADAFQTGFSIAMHGGGSFTPGRVPQPPPLPQNEPMHNKQGAHAQQMRASRQMTQDGDAGQGRCFLVLAHDAHNDKANVAGDESHVMHGTHAPTCCGISGHRRQAASMFNSECATPTRCGSTNVVPGGAPKSHPTSSPRTASRHTDHCSPG